MSPIARGGAETGVIIVLLFFLEFGALLKYFSSKLLMDAIKTLLLPLSSESLVVEIVATANLLLCLWHYRNSISYLKEDDYSLLASLLDTEVSKQALSILGELSDHKECGQKIAASGALVGIFNILDSQIQELLEPALKILSNLSSNGDVGSFIILSKLIPKLIPLFEDDSLASYCIAILNNLCNNREAMVTIADTEGCIAAIVKLLERDNREDQEHAVSILVVLCSQRVEFCQLVMDEGVIPGLVSISINGNAKASARAMELLRILKEESHAAADNSGSDATIDSTPQRNERVPPKASGFFEKIFAKSSAKKKK